MMYSPLLATPVILLALLLNVRPAAVAQDAAALKRAQPLLGSYEGMLGGKHAIRLQLSSDYQGLGGQYYYQRTGRALTLRGRVGADGTLVLRESAGYDTTATGRFVARRQPDGSLRGTWHNAAGTAHLPFKLTRVAAAAAVAKAQVTRKTYFRDFTAPVVLVPDAGVTRHLRERLSVEKLANETLAELRAEAANDDPTGLLDLRYSVNYNQDGLLSITSMREGVGNNVWYDWETFNLDLNTGFSVLVYDELRPEQLPAFLALGNKKLQKEIKAYLAGQHAGQPGSLFSKETAASIARLRFDLGSLGEYQITPAGLVFEQPLDDAGIGNFLFRTMHGELRVTFSAAELAPFLKPASPLRRLTGAAPPAPKKPLPAKPALTKK